MHVHHQNEHSRMDCHTLEVSKISTNVTSQYDALSVVLSFRFQSIFFNYFYNLYHFEADCTYIFMTNNRHHIVFLKQFFFLRTIIKKNMTIIVNHMMVSHF